MLPQLFQQLQVYSSVQSKEQSLRFDLIHITFVVVYHFARRKMMLRGDVDVRASRTVPCHVVLGLCWLQLPSAAVMSRTPFRLPASLFACPNHIFSYPFLRPSPLLPATHATRWLAALSGTRVLATRRNEWCEAAAHASEGPSLHSSERSIVP